MVPIAASEGPPFADLCRGNAKLREAHNWFGGPKTNQKEQSMWKVVPFYHYKDDLTIIWGKDYYLDAYDALCCYLDSLCLSLSFFLVLHAFASVVMIDLSQLQFHQLYCIHALTMLKNAACVYPSPRVFEGQDLSELVS